MPGRPKVIIYATCQGEYLANLMRCSPVFGQTFDLEYHSNISRPGVFNSQGISGTSLDNCAYFFYHQVQSPKNARIVRQILNCLPHGAVTVPLPYVTSNLYWPLCATTYLPIAASAQLPEGVFPYAWQIADLLLAAGHSPIRAAALTRSLDPAKAVNLAVLRQTTFAYWQNLDLQGAIKVNEFLRDNWQSQMLFYLYNHPARPVLLHIANQVLELLGLSPLSQEEASRAYLAQDQVYPVHPALANDLGLEFVDEDSRYAYRDKEYTFYGFLRYYLDVKSSCAA